MALSFLFSCFGVFQVCLQFVAWVLEKLSGRDRGGKMTEEKSVLELSYTLMYDANNREHVGLMLGLYQYLEKYMGALQEYGVVGERTSDVLINLPEDYKKKDKDETIEMLVLKLDE